jgi:hypothetical protein
MATWVGYPRSYTKGRARPIQYVVIHTTEGAENPTSAEDGAAYDRRRTDGTSTHLFVDSNSAVREVPDADRAHAARFHGNEIGVQVELCARAGQTVGQWHDAASLSMLRLAAREVAAICRAHDIPVRRLSVDQVRAAYYAPAGKRPKGICGHIDVTAAYPEDAGSHTDPGPRFPWSEFLTMVRAEMEDDDMPTADEIAQALLRTRFTSPGLGVKAPGWTVADWLKKGEAGRLGVIALQAKVDVLAEVLTKLAAGGANVDTAAILAGVDERLEAFREKVHADVDDELDEAFRAGADTDT